MQEYTLRSLVVHEGTLEKGHYYSYVFVKGGGWYKADDEKVGLVRRTDTLIILS